MVKEESWRSKSSSHEEYTSKLILLEDLETLIPLVYVRWVAIDYESDSVTVPLRMWNKWDTLCDW